jgi:hypothetical protein
VIPAAPVRVGLARATRWRMLLLFALATLVPAALATLPVWQFLSGLLDHAPRADLLARGMESSWLPDLLHALEEKPAAQAIPGGLLGGLVLALLVAPAMAGAALAEARSQQPLRFRPLMAGAGEAYGRMLRMAVASVLPLGAAGLATAGVFHLARKAGEKAVTEHAAVVQGRWALAAAAGLFFLAHLTVDAGRARMAAQPARRSAFLAWLSGTWMVVRSPIRAGRVGVVGAVAGIGLGLMVMALRQRLPSGPAWSAWAGVLLAQVAAATVGWGRAIRIAGLAELARGDAEATRTPADARPEGRSIPGAGAPGPQEEATGRGDGEREPGVG